VDLGAAFRAIHERLDVSQARGMRGGDFPERREPILGGSAENILFSTVREIPSSPTPL